MIRLTLVLLLAMLLLAVAASPVQAFYTITPIEVGTSSYVPYDMNDLGQVVGTYCDLAGQWFTFIWQNGSFTSLPGSGGFATNNSGQIAGSVFDESGFGTAALWSGGAWTPLGTLGGTTSNGSGINSLGTVVGDSADADGLSQAFIRRVGGDMTSLGNIGGVVGSYASGINDRDQVVGCGKDDSSHIHAFFWENGVMEDLGTFGGRNSLALDINNAGQAVGRADDVNGNRRAFIWEGEGLVDIGLPEGKKSAALSINDWGEVVGYVQDDRGNRRGFMWSETLGLLDPNALIPPDSGWTILSGDCINSNGQILASGEHNGNQSGVVLNVPEPSSFVALFTALAGGAGVFLKRRR